MEEQWRRVFPRATTTGGAWVHAPPQKNQATGGVWIDFFFSVSLRWRWPAKQPNTPQAVDFNFSFFFRICFDLLLFQICFTSVFSLPKVADQATVSRWLWAWRFYVVSRVKLRWRGDGCPIFTPLGRSSGCRCWCWCCCWMKEMLEAAVMVFGYERRGCGWGEDRCCG